VLELGAWWSAAAAGTHLGALGAEVIKVEPPAMDGWRLTTTIPGMERIWERGAMFNTFNLNKKGLVLDLARPEGRELFLRLVERSDVVLENFSPRVMPNLGLDYASLAARKPDIIMASISGYGATGPWREFVAYGVGFEQASGLSSVSGYRDDGLPRGINAYSDPIIGQWTALAILGSLERRRRTGQGQWIDVSAFECLTTFLGSAIAAYQLRGVEPPRLGNRHAAAAPHNIYACAGEDSWVGIAVLNDAQWVALVGVLGNPAWAAEPALARVAGRKANEDAIDAEIARWTAARRHVDVMAALQAAGVPAGAILAPQEEPDDPNFRLSRHFAAIDREVIGPVLYPHEAAHYDGAVMEHLSPSPLFGEHTREILRELAGLSEGEIEALFAEGVTVDVPLGYG
jgi:crotonobetainyl-CoA:carnitine CoA-transferase CaiB-like acyl-CoA transferase